MGQLVVMTCACGCGAVCIANELTGQSLVLHSREDAEALANAMLEAVKMDKEMFGDAPTVHCHIT